MWKSKHFSRGWLWQKRIWLRRNVKKRKRKKPPIFCLHYTYFKEEQKIPSIALKKTKKQTTTTTTTKNNNHSTGVRPWHSVNGWWAAVTPHGENHCHGELRPASPCLVLLSTTSQTAKSALPLSSVSQLEELSSLLVPSFLNCSICTAISSLHPGSWGGKTLGMF